MPLCLWWHNFVCKNLLWAGLHPAQLLFYTAWERMTAKDPLAINGDLNRDQGMLESPRIIQDGSYPVKALEVAESRVPG